MSAANRWWRDYEAECAAWLETLAPEHHAIMDGDDTVRIRFRAAWRCENCGATGVGGYHGCEGLGRYVVKLDLCACPACESFDTVPYPYGTSLVDRFFQEQYPEARRCRGCDFAWDEVGLREDRKRRDAMLALLKPRV